MQRSKDPSMARAGGTHPDKGRYVILWIVLLTLGLRLARLTFQPLWWDEGWSVYFATTGVSSMLRLTAVDIHPPLYYLLLHLWVAMLGAGPIALRLLSVCIGTATVPLLYTAGRQLFGKKAGLLAASLLALSPFHIYYSQEVRMYGLVTLLGLAAFYFALRWESGNQGIGRLGNWLGYVVAAAAALYTEYFAAFLLLALNLAVLGHARFFSSGGGGKQPRNRQPSLFPRKRRDVLAWLGAQGAVVLLYLPWLWYAGGKLLTYVRFKVDVEQDLPMGLFTYLGRHLAAFNWGHAEGILAGWWWVGLLPLVLLVVAVLWSLRKGISELANRAGAANRWLWVILLVLLVCGFAVNLVFPFNPPRSERLLLLALPAYLLLVAVALVALGPRHRLGAGLAATSFLVLSVLSLGFFYTVPRYPDDDYRPVAEQLRALSQPGDAIICVHPWQVGYFESYLPDSEQRPTLILTPREVLPRERQLWAEDPALMTADLDALLARHGRIWLPAHQAMGQILENRIEGYLAEKAYPVSSEWYGKNTRLSLFAGGEPAVQPVAAHFGEWLALDGASLSPGPLQAGWGVVAVNLEWQLSERPTDLYTVVLRLVGSTGHVWAQRDAPPMDGCTEFSELPVGEPQLDRHGLLVPAGTPPGEYRVTLQVYRSEDVSVLPVTFAGGSGGEVTLGTVRVVRPASPPPVEALAVTHPLRLSAGPLQLLGFGVLRDHALLPGEAVEVDLFWQTLADPGADFLPRLQLLNAEGQSVADQTEKPVAGTYPTAWWRAGELVCDPHALPVPAAVPAGRYRLALSLIRAIDGLPVEFRTGQSTVDLAEIEVEGREHMYTSPAPMHSQVARLGTSVELIGYDLQSPIADPQSPIALTLHWHALATPDRNYYTFVHLLDEDANIVAQHDGPPGNGKLPTLGWLPGEYLLDPHSLQLPQELPAGDYRLAVGLYDPATNIRLGDEIILDTPIFVRSEE
jgi:4-amino-4-deoxy-L-arabinose transferase-like glycosyltransferase